METELFNHLRIPDAVKDLPKFDGNRRTLYDFLENVEEILRVCVGIDGSAYGKILLRAIRNKVIGEANEILNMYGTPVIWKNIKENLILHYSDKRNETSLIKDLHGLSQNSDNIEKFYSKIIDIYSTIINHIKIHENDENVISSKSKLYDEMCLNTFLSGIREPLGSIIRAMRPQTLTIAFSYCLEEHNMNYLRNSGKINNFQSNMKKSILPFNSNPQNYQSFRTPFNYVQPRPQIPQYRFPSNQNHKFNYPNNNNNFPKNFNQPHHNYQPHNYKPNNQLPKPIPMDTTSALSKYKQPTRFPNYQNNYNNFRNQNSFRPTGPPNFKSQELFHIGNSNEIDELIATPQISEVTDQDYYPNLDHDNTNILNHDNNYKNEN